MIQLLRLLRGYVEFCAEGGFPERFINLCNIKGISLWNVKNDGVKVIACTTQREFELLSVPAQNSGMQIEIVKERGLKSFLKRHKWRWGVGFGLVAAFLFWFLMSGFVWEIEILETDGVNVEAFTESLEELGVKIGARKAKIDIIDVQNQLMNEYKELLWVSVNIFGGKVQVEMSEFKEQKEIVDTKIPVNLVASKKGEVVLVKGYKGVNAVKEGDNVTEGSLLISGIGLNADGSEYFVHAKGEVFAETENNEEFFCKKKNNFQVASEEDKRYFFCIFSFKIPFGLKTEGDFLTENAVFLESGKTVLPIGVVREDNFKKSKKSINFTTEEAELQGLFEAVEKKRIHYNQAKLEKVEYQISESEKRIKINLTINCIEDIAIESPILTES